MRRVNNIFEQVVSMENLRLADEKARRGKGKTYGVKAHDKHREENLLALREMLINGTYHTSPYFVFKIFEPKEREIFRLPYYPDRIVHHALMNVLEPIWLSVFTKDTNSCIKNRGIHGCLKSLKVALHTDKEGTKYCLKIDIRKFYPSINHRILKKIIRRKIKDKRVLALLDEIIDSVEAGVPIGNYLSQFFANLYLAYFDHWLKETMGIKYYWRYADDIVVLASSKEELHRLLREMRRYLYVNLDLRIKPNYQVFPVDARGIDFVGYVSYHTHTAVRKSIKQSLFRRVAVLNKMNPILDEKAYLQGICSWWGWLKHCDSKHLIKTLQKITPYELEFNCA